jgi:hypothetical protein
MKNRRRFLRDLGRGTMAAALAGVSAFLVSRRDRSAAAVNRGTDRRDHTCVNHWICRSCSRLADCPLPQALSAKARGVEPNVGEKNKTNRNVRNAG